MAVCVRACMCGCVCVREREQVPDLRGAPSAISIAVIPRDQRSLCSDGDTHQEENGEEEEREEETMRQGGEREF